MNSMFTVTRQPLDVPALRAAFACRYAARASPPAHTPPLTPFCPFGRTHMPCRTPTSC